MPLRSAETLTVCRFPLELKRRTRFLFSIDRRCLPPLLPRRPPGALRSHLVVLLLLLLLPTIQRGTHFPVIKLKLTMIEMRRMSCRNLHYHFQPRLPTRPTLRTLKFLWRSHFHERISCCWAASRTFIFFFSSLCFQSYT